jgi:methyltransferase
MPPSLLAYELLIGAVIVERGVELFRSRRNARELVSRGAIEHGQGHYPAMVALHTAFLLGCALEPRMLGRPFVPALGLPMVAVVLAAQSLRWWAVRTLGVHWNTRVLVLPSATRLTAGPYRWFSHPNYAAVIAEGIALPLIHSAWLTAALFTVLNAWLLQMRIRTENAALATMRAA